MFKHGKAFCFFALIERSFFKIGGLKFLLKKPFKNKAFVKNKRLFYAINLKNLLVMDKKMPQDKKKFDIFVFFIKTKK